MRIGIRSAISGLVLASIIVSALCVHLLWWRTAQQISRTLADTINDQIVAAVRLLRDKLKEDLREQILAAGPRRFERLIRDLLVAMEYGEDLDDRRDRPGGSDGGIDGIISQDKLGLERIYLQAKL